MITQQQQLMINVFITLPLILVQHSEMNYFTVRPHQFIILVSGCSLLEFGQNANKNANCLNLTLHFYFCLLLIKINAGQNKTCLEITNTSCVRLWLSPSFPLAQIGDLMPAQTSLQLVCSI